MKTIGTVAISAILVASIHSSYAATAAQQTEQLEQQITQLNQQIDSMAQHKVAQTHTALQLNTRQITHGYMHVVNPNETFFAMLPSTTFDLALLREREKFPDHSFSVGGYLEADAQYWNANDPLAVGENGVNTLSKVGKGLYLTTLDIDMMSTLNKWTTAFYEFEATGLGTQNITLNVRKALIEFGNLNVEPFFVGIGKSFLPFGVYYGGGCWSIPMTRSAFRPDEVPEVLFGYSKNGFQSNLAFFNNLSQTSNISDYVYSFFYTHALEQNVKYTIGAGYLNDMRQTPSALGNAYKSGGILSSAKRIPAYDLNADLNINEFDLNAEYLSAMRQGVYNSNATTKPQTVVSAGQAQGRASAWELGTGYSHPLFGKGMSYALSYSKTYHMAGIPMGWSGQAVPGPDAFNGIKSGWIASVVRTLDRNIFVGFEWQRGKTYFNKSGSTYTLDLSVYF